MTQHNVEWNGDALLDIIAQAAISALDDMHADVSSDAKGRVRVDSGDLKEGIGTEPAKRTDRTHVVGKVGVSEDVHYALIEEVTQPYLRPAYDRHAQGLGKRIGKLTDKKIK